MNLNIMNIFKFMETWIITVIDILENQKYESINNSTKKLNFQIINVLFDN